MCGCCSRVPYASLLACAIGGTCAVMWGIHTNDALTDTEAIPPLSNLAATWDKVWARLRDRSEKAQQII